MHQLAFTIGGISIHWYGVMAALGFLAGTLVLYTQRNHAKLTADQVSDLALFAMLAGVIGARIFYVIQFWSAQFQDNLLEIFRIDHGGLVFYGGFICAILVLLAYCLKKKISVPAVLDIFAPAIALGHAFGRIGCFLNGCCYGKACDLPWAVVFPQSSEPGKRYPEIPLHPVQLYEAVGNLLLFAIMLLLLRKLKTNGQTAAIYMVFYGISRFCYEFFRGDHSDHFWGLTPAQTIGLFLIPAGFGLFYYFRKRAADEHNGQSA